MAAVSTVVTVVAGRMRLVRMARHRFSSHGLRLPALRVAALRHRKRSPALERAQANQQQEQGVAQAVHDYRQGSRSTMGSRGGLR
jgi:hypothetical protein